MSFMQEYLSHTFGMKAKETNSQPKPVLSITSDGKIENKYIRRRSKKYSVDEFSLRNVRAQCRELRKKLFEEAGKQQFLRIKIERIMPAIADGKSQGKSTAKLGTELKMLLSECWWELRNGSWIVRQFEVVNYISMQRRHTADAH